MQPKQSWKLLIDESREREWRYGDVQERYHVGGEVQRGRAWQPSRSQTPCDKMMMSFRHICVQQQQQLQCVCEEEHHTIQNVLGRNTDDSDVTDRRSSCSSDGLACI